MPEPNGLEKRVRDLETDAARNEGEGIGKWDNQVKCNEDYDERLKSLEKSWQRATPILFIVALLVTAIGTALGTRIVQSLIGGD